MTLPIRSVTVHPDGAQVTRSGQCAAESGTVAIRGLPLMLDPTSVRVAVQGGDIAEVHTALDLIDDDEEGPPDLVETSVRARDALSVLDTRIGATEAHRRALASLGLQPLTDPEPELHSPQRFLAWRKAQTAIADRVAEVDDQLHQLRRQREDQAEALATLEERVRQASTEQQWRRWLPTRSVWVRLGDTTVDGDDAVQVELSYRVGGARWTPSYTLDADNALEAGRFSMRATVVQETGEDWSGVAITLSSAACEGRVDVPELAALRLGSAQSQPRTGFRALPSDLEGLFAADLLPSSSWETSEISETEEIERAKELGEDDFASLEESPVMDALALTDIEVSERDTRSSLGATIDSRRQRQSDRSEGGVTRGPHTMMTRTGVASPRPMPMEHAPMPEAARSAPMSGGKAGFAASVVLAPVAAGAALASVATGALRRSAPSDAAPGHRIAQASGEVLGGEGAVASDWLDYGSLRLATWTAPAGQRGRLRVVAEVEWLSERGAPPAAQDRFTAQQHRCLGAASRVHARPMPPHHILPAPIEGAFVAVEATGIVDVPSDGSPHSMAVRAWPAELRVAYRAVPRADPRAFRRVTASIGYPHPLLPGPVDVYVGGRLELTSPWSGSAGAGQLQIGLGAEDRLKVARNVRYREETAGVFGGSRCLHTTIDTTVASSLSEPASIEILEGVPVAGDDREVTIEVIAASPPAEVFEGDPDGAILAGGRGQHLEVDPGDEATATLTYAVTLGGKDELVGGDRRG